jgi:nucleoside-diphosphate-sugar epimerase
MSVLVTGGGLLGSQVADKLVQRGEKVILYERTPLSETAYELESLPAIVDMKRVKFVVGDLLDLPLLIDVINRENIDRIIHTASLLLRDAKAEPYKVVKVNIEGTLNVLEAARITNAKRVVFTSSTIVDSGIRNIPTKTPHEEDFVMRCISQRPTNVYAITKLTSEYLGLSYHELQGVDFAALRISGLFGPWKRTPTGVPSRVVDLFVRNAVLGKRVIVDDPLLTFSGVVDFIYSKDAAKACVLACFAPELKARVYNISWGRPYSFQDVIDTTKKVFPEMEVEVKEISKGGWGGTPVNLSAYDISKAKKDFGYEPDFDLESAFRDYSEWLEIHRVKTNLEELRLRKSN